MRPPMHPILSIAIKAARHAGSVINRATLNGAILDVKSKRANDFVTQVDKGAEEAAIRANQQATRDPDLIELFGHK